MVRSFIAETSDELRTGYPTSPIGQVVDTVRGILWLFVFSTSSHLFCYGLVSEQHEFFTSFVGIF